MDEKVQLNFTDLAQQYIDAPIVEKHSIAFDGEKYNRAIGGGFPNQTINFLVATPGVGKTNYLIHLCMEMLKNDITFDPNEKRKNFVFVSAELTGIQLMERFIAYILNYPFNRISELKQQKPELVKQVIDYVSKINQLDFIFSTDIEEISEKIAVLETEKGVDFVFLDHFHHLTTRKEINGHLQSQMYILEHLTSMYKEMDLCILSACQFRSSYEKDIGQRTMDDIEGTKKIRNFAHTILYLYVSEAQEKLNQANIGSRGYIPLCTIKLLKARDGWGGYRHEMLHNKAMCQFFEYDPAKHMKRQ